MSRIFCSDVAITTPVPISDIVKAEMFIIDVSISVMSIINGAIHRRESIFHEVTSPLSLVY